MTFPQSQQISYHPRCPLCTITHWDFFTGCGEGHFAAAREENARRPPTSERAREHGANVMSRRKNQGEKSGIRLPMHVPTLVHHVFELWVTIPKARPILPWPPRSHWIRSQPAHLLDATLPPPTPTGKWAASQYEMPEVTVASPSVTQILAFPLPSLSK